MTTGRSRTAAIDPIARAALEPQDEGGEETGWYPTIAEPPRGDLPGAIDQREGVCATPIREDTGKSGDRLLGRVRPPPTPPGRSRFALC